MKNDDPTTLTVDLHVLYDAQGVRIPLADANGQLNVHVGDVVYKKILGKLVASRVVALNPLQLG